MKSKINYIMVLFSIIGGIIGFLIGELLLNQYAFTMPHSILIGLYFGIIAFMSSVMCLLAELWIPHINGYIWRNQYFKSSIKFLIPSSFLLLFTAGICLQFLYEFQLGKNIDIKDVAIVIDMSGSMTKTDPKDERIQASRDLINSMKEDNRAAILTFNSTVTLVQPMTELNSSNREELQGKLKELKGGDDTTNIGAALQAAMKQINDTADNNRKSMVILLSDGEDSFNLKDNFNKVMEPFKTEQIPVYTIGMANNNYSMLKKIAKASGGNYFNVKATKGLKGTFNKIYFERQQRLLNDMRNGNFENDIFYGLLRVLFIMVIGALMALSVVLVFDNRYLLKSLLIGGALGGFIAGLWLEIGFDIFPWLGIVHRCVATIFLSGVFCFFTVSTSRKLNSRDRFGKDKNAKEALDRRRSVGRSSFYGGDGS